MKKARLSLAFLFFVALTFHGHVFGQVTVNGNNEGSTYDLSTSNQVAGGNASLSVGSGGTLTQSAPNALIGVTNNGNPYYNPFQFSGTETFSQTNASYGGPIAINGGTCAATAAGALGSAAVTIYGGTLNLSATNALSGAGSISMPYAFQTLQVNITAPQNYSGVTLLNSYETGGITISGSGSLSNSAITLEGPYTALNLQTSGAISGGSLTFAGGGASFSETAPDAITGTTSVTVTSASNAIISGSNNYTGATTIIGGSNPFNAGTGNEYYIPGGTALDFGQTTSPTNNIINNGISHANIATGSSLVLSGSLSVVGGHGLTNTQEFNGMTLTPGNSSLTADAGGGGGNVTVTLNGITRQTGSVVNFNYNNYAPSGTGTAATTTTNTNANFTGGQQTILGGWATFGGYTWATVGAGGAISGLATYTNFGAGSNIAGTDVEAGGASDLNAVVSNINSIRFSGTTGDVAFGNNLTIATGGILVTNGQVNYIEGTTGNDGGAGAGYGANITSGNGQDLIYNSFNGSSLQLAANIVDNGGSPIGLTVAGDGLSLWGTNTFTGQVTINSGTVTLDSADALDGQNKVVFGGDGGVGSGSLSLNGNSITISGLTDTQSYAINSGQRVYNGNTGSQATLTVNNATTDTYDGGISDNGNNQSGSASLNFVKTGAGTLNLTTAVNNNNNRVALDYTGTTTISGGEVYLGASSGSSYLLNTSIITINGGGSIGAGGNATTIGHAYTDGPQNTGALGEFQGVQIQGGSTAATRGSINLQDGYSDPFRIAQDAGQTALYIGGSTGNPAAISLDVGGDPKNAYNPTVDSINLQYASSYYTSGNVVNSGNIYIAPGGFLVNLNGLGTLTGTPYGPVNIMEVAGFDSTSTGFGGNTYGAGYTSFAAALSAHAIALGTTTGNFNGYTVGLTSGTDPNSGYDLELTETANPTPTSAYFSGAQGTSGSAWTTFTGGNANNSNWTTADNGSTDTNQSPGATTDVYFGTAPTAPGALADYLNNSITADTTIKSLTFTGNSTGNITIGGPNHFLTINGNSGNGITVDSGAGAETITANVNLGSSQTWTNNSSNPLTVTGDVIDNNLTGNNQGVSQGYSLTKSGTGTLALGGSNSYSGGTTVAQGTLNAVNTVGSATGSGAVQVSNGATLGGNGIIAPAAGNNVTLLNGAVLSPGLAGVGSLTFNLTGSSTLAFSANSTLSLTLGTNATSVAFGGSAGDYLSGSGNATLSLTLGSGFDYGDTYIVFSNIDPTGFTFNAIGGYDSLHYTAVFTEASGNIDTLTFTPTSVPEPSEVVLLVLGLGLLVLVNRRKLRFS